MTPEITTYQGPTVIEMLGVYPLVLVLSAIVIGIISIVMRRSNINRAASHALVGIGILGAGTTAWRTYRMYSFVQPGGAVDPSAWMLDEANAWMASGVVLPAVGIGMMMIAVSTLFTKPQPQ